MQNLPVSNDSGYYSTKHLAKLLRVNETTIRRWANAGMLKCFRTPGGHRKFTAYQISGFIRKYEYELLCSDAEI